jgi:hypothetical protein
MAPDSAICAVIRALWAALTSTSKGHSTSGNKRNTALTVAPCELAPQSVMGQSAGDIVRVRPLPGPVERHRALLKHDVVSEASPTAGPTITTVPGVRGHLPAHLVPVCDRPASVSQQLFGAHVLCWAS